MAHRQPDRPRPSARHGRASPSRAPRSASSTPTTRPGTGDPGERGELLIRGPQVFGGYWGKPEETAAALLDGGWFRTGDIVVVDADGFVSIVDRIKELIITGGFNVMPSEVEAVLRAHPGRRRCRRRRAAQAPTAARRSWPP